jgi:septal ring factor EnvC (AmiA/AmiB activator)
LVGACGLAVRPLDDQVEHLEADADVLRREVERIALRLTEDERDIQSLRDRLIDMVAGHEENAKKLWAALANLQMNQSEQHKILKSILDTLEINTDRK